MLQPGVAEGLDGQPADHLLDLGGEDGQGGEDRQEDPVCKSIIMLSRLENVDRHSNYFPPISLYCLLTVITYILLDITTVSNGTAA